jgi:hypothetical protein
VAWLKNQATLKSPPQAQPSRLSIHSGFPSLRVTDKESRYSSLPRKIFPSSFTVGMINRTKMASLGRWRRWRSSWQPGLDGRRGVAEKNTRQGLWSLGDQKDVEAVDELTRWTWSVPFAGDWRRWNRVYRPRPNLEDEESSYEYYLDCFLGVVGLALPPKLCTYFCFFSAGLRI